MQDVVRAEIAAQFQKVVEPGAAQLGRGATHRPLDAEARKPISAHEEAFLEWKGGALSDSSTGDAFPDSGNDSPRDVAGWQTALDKQARHVGLPEGHPLAGRIHKLFVPVCP